jgi:putative transposase
MAKEPSIPLRQALRKLFPSSWLRTEARRCGAVQRLRKVSAVALFWTLVLGFGTGQTRSLAGLRRAYERSTGATLQESSFYARFTAPLVALLKRALARVFTTLSLGTNRALRGTLASFLDVLLADATVVRLHDFLARLFPACRTNHTLAALKLHVLLSVTGAGGQSVRITAARAHDGPILRVGPWVRDRLLLFELAYFKYQLFARITENGGYFVSRLKGRVNPTIVGLHRVHRGRAIPVVGETLRAVVDRLHREVLDVEVEVSFPRRAYRGRARRDRQRLRVVGARAPGQGGYFLYITNIPPEQLAAEDISAVYALRWEIELLFLEWKRCYRLDELPSQKRVIVEALLFAALLTWAVSRRLWFLLKQAHRAAAERLPLRRFAALVAEVAGDLLEVVLRPAGEAASLERRLSRVLRYEAQDTHRDRPSLLRAVEERRHRLSPAKPPRASTSRIACMA